MTTNTLATGPWCWRFGPAGGRGRGQAGPRLPPPGTTAAGPTEPVGPSRAARAEPRRLVGAHPIDRFLRAKAGRRTRPAPRRPGRQGATLVPPCHVRPHRPARRRPEEIDAFLNDTGRRCVPEADRSLARLAPIYGEALGPALARTWVRYADNRRASRTDPQYPKRLEVPANYVHPPRLNADKPVRPLFLQEQGGPGRRNSGPATATRRSRPPACTASARPCPRRQMMGTQLEYELAEPTRRRYDRRRPFPRA